MWGHGQGVHCIALPRSWAGTCGGCSTMPCYGTQPHAQGITLEWHRLCQVRSSIHLYSTVHCKEMEKNCSGRLQLYRSEILMGDCHYLHPEDLFESQAAANLQNPQPEALPSARQACPGPWLQSWMLNDVLQDLGVPQDAPSAPLRQRQISTPPPQRCACAPVPWRPLLPPVE